MQRSSVLKALIGAGCRGRWGTPAASAAAAAAAAAVAAAAVAVAAAAAAAAADGSGWMEAPRGGGKEGDICWGRHRSAGRCVTVKSKLKRHLMVPF